MFTRIGGVVAIMLLIRGTAAAVQDGSTNLNGSVNVTGVLKAKGVIISPNTSVADEL